MKISDLSTTITKGTTPSTIGGKFVNAGINYIKVESITQNNTLDFSNVSKITADIHRTLNRSQLQEYDLLITIAGALGRTYVVEKEILPANTNQAVGIVRLKTDKCNPYFISYWLKTPWIQKLISNANAQSIQNNLNLENVANLPLPNFDLNTQNQIANILGNLDRKIEINNKIHAELEAMSKLIYDYWFVQFDFPDKNGKPYKSSGGKMVWSEELKREIPEGWEVKQLSDLIKIERGISYTSKDIQEAKGQPMLNLNSFYLDGSYKVDGVKYFSGTASGNKTAAPGDLLIAATDVTRNADIIGKSFIVPNIFHGNQIYYSMDLAKIVPIAHIGNHYLRFLFNSDFYHSYIKYFATGTLVLHLNMDGVNWFKLPLPPSEIISKFNELMHSIESKKSQIIKENQKLVELRDWLLPMLMNGQVKVSE